MNILRHGHFRIIAATKLLPCRRNMLQEIDVLIWKFIIAIRRKF